MWLRPIERPGSACVPRLIITTHSYLAPLQSVLHVAAKSIALTCCSQCHLCHRIPMAACCCLSRPPTSMALPCLLWRGFHPQRPIPTPAFCCEHFHVRILQCSRNPWKCLQVGFSVFPPWLPISFPQLKFHFFHKTLFIS